MTLKEIAFVGNAPGVADIADDVDGADWVVRFNKTRGYGGRTGRRIDDLFLINCGGQMHEWLHEPAFWTGRPLADTRYVSLPIASHQPGSGLRAYAHSGPDDRHGVNFETDVRARLRDRAASVRTLPEAVRRAAIAALAAIGGPTDGPIWPSTGFLALFWYDRMVGDGTRLALHGFGFSGWSGHPWAREREWVARRARSGRVRLA